MILLKIMSLTIMLTFVAFFFHKYLPKKFCSDRTKFINIISEFLLQFFGYCVFPIFILMVYPFYILCCNYNIFDGLQTILLKYDVILNIKNSIYILIFFFLSLPFLIWGLRFKKLKQEYPLWKNFCNASILQKTLYEIVYLIYYINWELFFRGILLLLLVQSTESMTSNAFQMFLIFNTLQSIFAGLFHYDKPLPEFILSFPTSFIFGYIAYGFNSILPCIIIHYLIGVTFDILVTYIKPKNAV